jgi:DNA helicase IV
MTSDRSFAVSGAAGTGKTLLAAWRAAELEQRGINYIVIVYTRLLKNFIADSTEETGIDSDKVYYYEEWERANCPSADYVIADEVQDFAEGMLASIKRAAREHLIIFGDSAQQIYENAPFIKGKLYKIEEIAEMYNLAMLPPLIENYRLTKKVARVANYLWSRIDPFFVDWCVNEGDSKPKLVSCSSYENKIKFIINRIQKESLDDVGILFSRNDEVESLSKSFNNLEIEHEKKIGFGNQASNVDFNSTLPKIMTMHSAKGLQFEAVFLPNYSFRGDSPKWKRTKYVALTRTYKHVYILYTGSNPFNGVVDDSKFEIMNGDGFTDYETNRTQSLNTPSFNSSDLENVDDDLPF